MPASLVANSYVGGASSGVTKSLSPVAPLLEGVASLTSATEEALGVMIVSLGVVGT